MTSETHISLALYRYMCKNIVGTEKTVKTKRMFISANDGISYNKGGIIITSGSFGEGLEMEGSDLDVMYVLSNVSIYETFDINKFDPETDNFVMELDGTKPGFSKLRLIGGERRISSECCIKKGGDLYLSNSLLKSHFTTCEDVIHGPCLSKLDGFLDIALCLHCKSWITPAREWIYRLQNEWPSDNIKSCIVDHGVLFVPVGVKGSDNEEFEWRISFSVAEKLLIYSFTHTQLLCYALMKILLKDVIEKDIRCKDLLCSYFLKTIIFWVSEELPLSVWQPANLVNCFLRCFDRLIYCVKHSTCPHYFIPDNNLFENKSNQVEWTVLQENLNELRSYGWRCLLTSEKLSVELSTQPGFELQESFPEQILSSKLFERLFPLKNYKNSIKAIIYHNSYTVNSYWIYVMSRSFKLCAESLSCTGTKGNKNEYKHYNTCLSHLLLSIQHNALSGWLLLASFFYKMKQYRLSLNILSYSLSKCSPEHDLQGKLSNEQCLFKSCQYIGLRRTLKAVDFKSLSFDFNSRLIPEELELEVQDSAQVIPPVAFAHFLCFLCYYHLGDIRQYRSSLTNIYLTITEKYFVWNDTYEGIANNYLGIACQLIGDSEEARRAFFEAVKLDKTNRTRALQRLHMMDK